MSCCLAVTMESPSAKVSVLLQSEKKLKQATLPFEIVKISSKTDSQLLKKQKLNNLSKVESSNGDLEIMKEININSKETSPRVDSSQMVVEEIAPEVVPEVEIMSNSKIEIGETGQEKLKSSDCTLIENCVEDSVGKCVSKSVNEITIINDDDDDALKSSKRKLESAEKLKEVKPPKRAKLIYNVDKISISQRTEKCNVNSVNIFTSSSNSKSEQKSSDDCSESSLWANAVVSNIKSGGGKHDFQSKLEENDVKETGVLTIVDKTVKPLVEESVENSNRSLFIKENAFCINDKCNVDNMDVDSESSVEVLTPADMCEKMSEENCSSPSLNSENCSPSGKNTMKQLKPRQLERKSDVAKRREEIQQERERKKLEKDRMKQEKEEEKARLKQEKEEVKKKMKEEKEKRRLVEIELKNEEKRKKEEEKRKKEEEKQEEKRKKEEQKLEDKRKKEEMLKKKEEEQKKKITKEARVFSSFFKKCDSRTSNIRDDGSFNEVVFMPFTVRADMRLAPVNRNPMDHERRSKFEELFNLQSVEITYLEELRNGVVVPMKSNNTWPLEEKYEEVVVLDEGLDLNDAVAAGPEKKFNDRKPKLLQFHENRRPPYWGTWRKKSKNVRPKAPLGKDQIFDYEVDSDDEWEEEEPGESLHGSDDEKESEDEYEVDNDFFVPHGYLSDDENPEEEMISPETQKAKLKLLGEQFDLERNEKTKLLKPILLGCIWFNSDLDEPASAKPSVVAFLNKRKAVPWTDVIPIPALQDENTDPAEVVLSDSVTPTSNKESIFPESAVPDLITFIYGSTNSRKNLAKTFLMQWNKKQEDSVGENEANPVVLSQARIARKIKELANWMEFPEEGPLNGKFCWYVRKEVREKFGLLDLSIFQKGDDISDVRDLDACKKISPSLITKFTKVLTEDERRNQITKARRPLSLPKPLTESIPSSPKQITPLKSLQKLKEFWAKPSLSSKYNPSFTVDTDEVMVTSPRQKNDSDVASEKTCPVNNEGKNGDNIEDCEMIEIKDNSENSSSADVGSAESSKRELGPAPSEDRHKIATCEVTSSSDGCGKQSKADSKAIVKKRVAILYSAPRGCEIVKPDVAPKKPNILVDDAQKSENCNGDLGETKK